MGVADIKITFPCCGFVLISSCIILQQSLCNSYSLELQSFKTVISDCTKYYHYVDVFGNFVIWQTLWITRAQMLLFFAVVSLCFWFQF